MLLRKKIALFLIFFVLIAFSGFIIWASNAMSPQDMANEAMKGTKQVNVNSDSFTAFIPQNPFDKGLIIYPGAKVSPQAYAPIALGLAKGGLLTVIVDMPLNLAFFASNKALKVMEEYPGVKNWSISGHSLGGAMACKFVHDNPGIVDNLILLAAYTTSGSDLSKSNLPVLSITASNDGLTTRGKIEKSRSFLPSDTLYYEIEGGNHAQFGDYGIQMGDGQAEISRLEQLDITISKMLSFLEG